MNILEKLINAAKNLQPVKMKWPIVYESKSLDLTISAEKRARAHFMKLNGIFRLSRVSKKEEM